MKIQKIDKKTFEDFAKLSPINSFYQSPEWLDEKQLEGKKGELLGLYEDDTLVGVSVVLYLKVLKKYSFAYASRGFLYDYQSVTEFKDALKDYFSNKFVIFVKIDPPIILAYYDKDLNKQLNEDNLKLIDELKENGFKHFGFNMGGEAYQFRFVHRLTLMDSYEEQLKTMSKSTLKNIEIATSRGVKIKETDDLDLVYDLFQKTVDRKELIGFSKNFYKNLIDTFKDKCKMYLVYIDKKIYISNLENELKELNKQKEDIENEMQRVNVGDKLKKKIEIVNNKIQKNKEQMLECEKLDDITYIASMMTITKYDEVSSLTSGMNNDYRAFCPKYVMYPKMIQDAFKDNLKYVNFLGVRNIFDEFAPSRGVYEVKRGFGGQTIEYIGEFDLPIKKGLYYIYKIINKIKR